MLCRTSEFLRTEFLTCAFSVLDTLHTFPWAVACFEVTGWTAFFHVLLSIYTFLLPEGQMGEAWEPFRNQSSFGNRGTLYRIKLSLFLLLLRYFFSSVFFFLLVPVQPKEYEPTADWPGRKIPVSSRHTCSNHCTIIRYKNILTRGNHSTCFGLSQPSSRRYSTKKNTVMAIYIIDAQW